EEQREVLDGAFDACERRLGPELVFHASSRKLEVMRTRRQEEQGPWWHGRSRKQSAIFRRIFFLSPSEVPMRLALCVLLLPVSVASAETHRFKPTVGYPTFAVRPPVLTVKPGDVVESESLWGEWYEKPGGKWPGEVGPIAIEGAEPGDTLVVEILKVRPNRDTAVSTQGGRFGALVPDSGTAMLNDAFPRGRYVWRIDRAAMTGTLDLPGSALKSVTVPLRPMLGRVATAPPGQESWDGLWPGVFGGNMDDSDIREGTTVYLPVFHPGALFYSGDAHALQGDGE